MKYRPLGNTGLTVSEISFGTGDNAGLMVLGSEEDQLDAVRRALELGVNYFDTSPDYGKGAAERNLGRALRRLGAKPIVTTKVEIMPGELDRIEEKVTSSLDASLDRLGMDSVDILVMHNKPQLAHDVDARNWIPLTPADMLGPAMRGFERARAAGKVKFFGFVCDEADRHAVIQLLETGKFHVVNVWFNLVNPSAGYDLPPGMPFGPDYTEYTGVLAAAQQNGAGTAIIRPLDGGALSMAVIERGAAARHAHAGGLYTRAPELFNVAAQRGRAFRFLDVPGRSLPQAAFAFILSNSAVSTVIGGFSDVAQFEELVGCAGAPPLSEAEMARIADVYRNNFFLSANATQV
jgi:aryl-alcohol dehydrogenase-like predicted oxidoreductase